MNEPGSVDYKPEIAPWRAVDSARTSARLIVRLFAMNKALLAVVIYPLLYYG